MPASDMTDDRIVYESPKPAPNAPVACTVDLSNASVLRAGLNAYRAVFALLLATERFDGGFRDGASAMRLTLPTV